MNGQRSERSTTWDTKKNIIQAYLMVQKSWPSLMQRSHTHWHIGLNNRPLSKYINLRHSSDQHSIGAIALLKKCLRQAEHHHSVCEAAFSAQIDGQVDIYSDSEGTGDGSMREYEED